MGTKMSTGEWCRVCDGRGKFVFLVLDSPVPFFEEYSHFGCRGTGLRTPEEFRDIPSINPSTDKDPVRGVVFNNGIRFKADSVSGEIHQEPQRIRMMSEIRLLASSPVCQVSDLLEHHR
jgi:hypothetical protein